MKYSVGKDVLAYCNKCKLTLSHIIVSMLNTDVIAKVECNTCHSAHKYKEKTPDAVKKRRVTKKKGRKVEPTVPVNDIWKDRLSNMEGEHIKYSIKKKFEIGDLIEHPKFGVGIVQEVVDKEKINVMFQYEIKTLVHGR